MNITSSAKRKRPVDGAATWRFVVLFVVFIPSVIIGLVCGILLEILNFLLSGTHHIEVSVEPKFE